MRSGTQSQTQQPVCVWDVALHSCSEFVIPFGIEYCTSHTSTYCQQTSTNQFSSTTVMGEDSRAQTCDVTTVSSCLKCASSPFITRFPRTCSAGCAADWAEGFSHGSSEEEEEEDLLPPAKKAFQEPGELLN